MLIMICIVTWLVLGLSTGAQSEEGTALPTISPAEAIQRSGPIDRGDDSDARALVGKVPPSDLPRLQWLDGVSRDLRSLSGDVVVIRSFTNACPFCAATMPALEKIHHDYNERGVRVLGVYHPKPPRAVASADVADFSRSLGVTFPIAIDLDWQLVEKWWISPTEAPWTSVTWVLDRNGIVRWIHPGGEYHPDGGKDHDRCREDEASLRRMIETLLTETG
jgi:thiol-disulfide isomerase/thioredoxin